MDSDLNTKYTKDSKVKYLPFVYFVPPAPFKGVCV